MNDLKRNRPRQYLLEALVFFSQKKKLRSPSKMMIYKVIAEFDFRHFQETGFTVTDQKYEAFQWGPVPQPFHNEITLKNTIKLPDDFRDSLSIVDTDFENEFGENYRGFKFIAKRKPNLKIFSPRQTRILEEIAEIYKFATATEASKASHEPGKPWTITVKNKGEHSIINLFDTIKLNEPLTIDIVKEKLKEKVALNYNYGT
jgi:uncharacterized phage-associated protein